MVTSVKATHLPRCHVLAAGDSPVGWPLAIVIPRLHKDTHIAHHTYETAINGKAALFEAISAATSSRAEILLPLQVDNASITYQAGGACCVQYPYVPATAARAVGEETLGAKIVVRSELSGVRRVLIEAAAALKSCRNTQPALTSPF